MKKTIYVSVDIEADGPIPGVNSMLSLGAAAFDPDIAIYNSSKPGEPLIGTFSENLKQLTHGVRDKKTMEWWAERPEAWKAATTNMRWPADVMKSFVRWLKELDGQPVFVGYPAGFDFTFVYWYLIRYAGNSPFSFSAVDMKTYASCLLNLPYRCVSKRRMPKEWFTYNGLPIDRHSHVAVGDAIEQGYLFMNMLRARMEIDTKLSEFEDMIYGNDYPDD